MTPAQYHELFTPREQALIDLAEDFLRVLKRIADVLEEEAAFE